MAIIIQKLTNVVNLIDDTRPLGSQIITSIELTSTAKLQLKGGTIPNVVQIFDSTGNQTANIEIAPDLLTQDEGAAAQPWVGTDDELINKLNNEYFTAASGGGGTCDLTTVENLLGDIVTKQDETCDGNPQNVKDCLTLKTPSRYFIVFSTVPNLDIQDDFEFSYFDNTGAAQTFSDNGDLSNNSPYADLAALVAEMNGLTGVPVQFGEPSQQDLVALFPNQFAIEILDGTILASQVVEIEAFTLDGDDPEQSEPFELAQCVTGFDYIAEEIKKDSALNDQRNLTIIDELQSLVNGIESETKYNGLSFDFNNPDSALGGGISFPVTIGLFSFTLRSGETLNYFTDAANPRPQSLQDLCDVFNSQIDLVNLNVLAGNTLVMEEGKILPNSITSLSISNDDGSAVSVWNTYTQINETLDNFSKIRRTLKDIKNEVETSNKQFAVYDTLRLEIDDSVFDFSSLSPFPNTVVGASIIVESGQFRHLVQGDVPRNPTFSAPIQGILSSSGANIKVGKTPEFPLQDKDEFSNWRAICDTGEEAIINVILYKFKYQ